MQLAKVAKRWQTVVPVGRRRTFCQVRLDNFELQSYVGTRDPPQLAEALNARSSHIVSTAGAHHLARCLRWLRQTCAMCTTPTTTIARAQRSQEPTLYEAEVHVNRSSALIA